MNNKIQKDEYLHRIRRLEAPLMFTKKAFRVLVSTANGVTEFKEICQAQKDSSICT